MEVFKHVSNTWLVAQLIHPFFFYGLIGMAGWEWMDPSYGPLLVIFSFLFSVPAYILWVFSFGMVCRVPVSPGQKFLLWNILIILCILLGVYSICLLFFDGDSFFETIVLTIPGIGAAIISACIRFKQFVSTVNFLGEESLTP